MEAYIYDAVRMPRGKGKKDGSLHGVMPLRLATIALRAIRDRNQLDTALVDNVMLGCVEPVGEQGAYIGRVAVLSTGYVRTTAGVQISHFCAPGLEACNMAATQVMVGQSDFAIGDGVESMSRVPMGASGDTWPVDPAAAISLYFVPRGVLADIIATKWGYSRHDVDAYAAESHRRVHPTSTADWLTGSIMPVRDQNGPTTLDRNEMVRPQTTIDTPAQLKPSSVELGERYGFDAVIRQRYPELGHIEHVHHASNSSGIVDGAAAVLIGSHEVDKRVGLKLRARIRSFASISSESSTMLTGPPYATEKALKRAGMSVADIGLYELNEAFASVVLRFMEVLAVPHDRINVNGGAIAVGHPLDATGAMILSTLLDELERRGASTGLAMLCAGVGIGTATIIERL